jgi:hypothetical protein
MFLVRVQTNVMRGLFKNNLSRKTIEQFSHGKLSLCKYLNWFMFKQINFGSGFGAGQTEIGGLIETLRLIRSYMTFFLIIYTIIIAGS